MHPLTFNLSAALALALGVAGIAAATSAISVDTGPATYALVYVTETGESYVLDHDMPADDCLLRARAGMICETESR